MQFKQLLPAALVASVAAQAPADLASALGAESDLSTLASLVGNYSELVTAVASTPNLTLLAPSNKAFEDFAAGPLGAALNDSGIVAAVLSYHVLNGTYQSSAITDTPTFVPTLLTNETYTNVTGGQVVEAVKVGDKVYFISGSLTTNATVSKADIAYNNGVVHIIDSLLIIPANVSTTATTNGLTYVAGALVEADLVEAVDTTPDVTIFAPANAAFEDIGSILGNITKEDLSSVLTYHVVNGTVAYSTDLSDGQKVPTLQGTDVTISLQGEDVYVNNAKVIIPNVLVANGVVHVIDAVLNPNNATATPDTASGADPAFSGASSATNLPFTSNVPASTTGAGASATGAGASATSGAAPMRTAAVGAAALFGAGAVMYNM